MMSDQLAFLLRNIPNLLIGFPNHRPGGLLLTLLLAVVAVGVGFVLAIFIGSGRESRKRPLRTFCALYIWLFRGLPLILLLLLVHQILSSSRQFGLNPTARTSAFVTLIFYSSAYQAEIVRAGLRIVPPNLVEAARLMGSTPWQVTRLIKLRYSLRAMLPAFTGEAISLFKDTSVVIILGVADLTTVGRLALGGQVGNAPYWMGMTLLVGFVYFIVAFSLYKLALRWENRLHAGNLVHSLANY